MYWENRYRKGGNSGKGSYGELCEFKSKIINDIIKRHKIKSLADLGVGDGNQLKHLNVFDPDFNYTGYDVSHTVIKKCKSMFELRFEHVDDLVDGYDMSMSMDVLYHLVDIQKFESYIDDLFRVSNKIVVIYARNENVKQHAEHVLFREFVTHIVKHFPEWKIINHIPGMRDQSPSDFYVFGKDL